MRKLLSALVLFVSFVGALPVAAMETDQYNLSPIPLADIAPEVEEYVSAQVTAAVDDLNAEITKHEADKDRSRIDELRSPDAVARAVYEHLGKGSIFHTSTGKWLNSHKFEHEPSRFSPPFKESIYWTAPINFATMSPTIRMYGVEFGTDKLDHFFQQGYRYYTKFKKGLKQGKTPVEAEKSAVSWGRVTENTYFGYMVSGVYSNADLAANFAGMRFYEGLTDYVRLVDGRWTTVTRTAPDTPLAGNAPVRAAAFLRPFVTDHLNEALNPSVYLFFVYPVVKGVVRKSACPEWRAAYPNADREEFDRRSAALETWDGVDYGFKRSKRQVRIGETCFADKAAS